MTTENPQGDRVTRAHRPYRYMRPEIQAFYQGVIDRSEVPPFYRDAAVQFGVGVETVFQAVKSGKMLAALRDLRQNQQIEIFPQTREVAWFMGMLTGTSGHVDYNPVSIYFTNKSQALRDAFRQSGEEIIYATNPRAKAHERIYRGNVNPSVVFHSKRHVEAIGDFRKKEKAKTIYERFDWVLQEPFLIDFASGIFDSAGYIDNTDLTRQISFYSTVPPMAELYRDILTRLGLESADLIKLYGAARIQSAVQGARIKGADDLRTYAQIITSADAERQRELTSLKTIKRREIKVHMVRSAQEVFEEWIRVGGDKASSQLTVMKNRGLTWLTPYIVKSLFGKNPQGGSLSYPVARRVLNVLAVADEAEVATALASVEVKNTEKREYRRKYTNAQLFTEYHRVKAEECNGQTPTYAQLQRLHRAGKTTINPQQYVAHLGDNGFGKSFEVAQGHLERSISDETPRGQIYP